MEELPSIGKNYASNWAIIGRNLQLAQQEGTFFGRATAIQLSANNLDCPTSFDINPQLSAREHSSLTNVLAKYQDVSAKNPKQAKKITTTEHNMILIDPKPVRQRSPRVSPAIEEEINRQIDEMTSNRIIRPSTSPWASRIILVRKKDGSHIFAVDFRNLNEASKKDMGYASFLDMRDLFDRMHGSNIFSTQDGASAYWSVPFKEADKELTAFVSTRGQFEFNRMPFGLCNAQASYQRAVDQALRRCAGVQAFVNDSCVHSPDFKSHLAHLEGVLLRVAQAGIQLRASKCRFGYPEVELLGHLISPKEEAAPIRDGKDLEFPRPTSSKQVCQFMGLLNWYRQYLPDGSLIVEPLRQLTRRDVQWYWSPHCEASYQRLNSRLTTGTQTLAFPNWSVPLIRTKQSEKSCPRWTIMARSARSNSTHPA